MGENTHACCCDHSEEALLKRIGELAAEYTIFILQSIIPHKHLIVYTYFQKFSRS